MLAMFLYKYRFNYWENLKIPKGVIRSFKSKDRQYNGEKKTDEKTKNDLQNTRKLKIEQHEPHRKKQELNSVVWLHYHIKNWKLPNLTVLKNYCIHLKINIS